MDNIFRICFLLINQILLLNYIYNFQINLAFTHQLNNLHAFLLVIQNDVETSTQQVRQLQLIESGHILWESYQMANGSQRSGSNLRELMDQRRTQAVKVIFDRKGSQNVFRIDDGDAACTGRWLSGAIATVDRVVVILGEQFDESAEQAQATGLGGRCGA